MRACLVEALDVGDGELPAVADDAVLRALAIVVERDVGLKSIAPRWDIEWDALRERACRTIDLGLRVICEDVGVLN